MIKKITPTALSTLISIITKKTTTIIVFTTASGLATANTVNVYDTTQLQTALNTASPGDIITLHPGNYIGSRATSGETRRFYDDGFGRAYFYSNKNGTRNAPITLTSANKNNKQTLLGDNINLGYVFLLEGDHWIIKNLKFSGTQKGIMLEGANHNVMDNVEVYNTGQEAVHFRNSSSYNTIKNCYIHSTGKRVGYEGSAEGVYIGTNKGNEADKQDFSDYNRIAGCKIGPGITAESIDVKAGTTGTVIEYNHLLADGIIGTAGSPQADSFIDLKGTDVIVRNNYMDWGGDTDVDHAIYTFREHRRSNIYDNEIRLNRDSGTFRAQEETLNISNNVRLDGGTELVTRSYAVRNISYTLDPAIEQPNLGPYACFDELTSGCGSEPSTVPTPTPAQPAPITPEETPEETPQPVDTPEQDPTPEETPINTHSGAYCNWYGDRTTLCENDQSGWGFENGESCISRDACTNNQPADRGGIMGSETTPEMPTQPTQPETPVDATPTTPVAPTAPTEPEQEPEQEPTPDTPTEPVVPVSASCQLVDFRTSAELDLSQSNCVTFSQALDNGTVSIKDSDTHRNCDFRGNATDGSNTVDVNRNFIKGTGFTGNTVTFNANNNCQFIQVKAY